ncbi:sensor histidine kinase [Streptomyces sp. NPDC058613]|uniref:sensor histidine kinase n=1 Tax=Streptomyces sp. NPDC058613 TaxID=3346556 RepID=UPI00365DF2BE
MTKARSLLLLLPPIAVAFMDSWDSWELDPDARSPAIEALLLLTPPLLLLRRRYPLTLFVMTLPVLYTGAFFAPLVPLFSMARAYGNRILLAGCGLVYFLLSCSRLFLTPDTEGAWRELLALSLLYVATNAGLTTAALALGMLLRTRRELAARLTELAEAHEREKQLHAQRVLSDERARLAREMHDVVAHHVSLISVQIGALQVSTTDPRTRETARSVRQLAAHTLDQLRTLLGVLRTSGGNVEAVVSQPCLAGLPGLVSESCLDITSRFDVPLTAPAPGSRSESVQRAAFRTAQEALTNIRKHAPGARAHVHLYEHDQHLHIEVRNGPPRPGAPASHLPSSGHGLLGLRERAHLLGGTLLAYPLHDGGFLIHAAFPHRPRRTEAPRRPAGAGQDVGRIRRGAAAGHSSVHAPLAAPHRM